ncbi:MAG: CoA transferase [Chloroflexi bacterium]|nr:CoA transferase [Chloroflexota bacterium]
MARPLKGVRVLDLSWVLSGPYCTMILADLGAEVVKVERPEVGDTARGNGPFVNGSSTYFVSLNRGKKSVALDLKARQGKALFLRLAEKADAVIENMVPGTMQKMGLGYRTLRRHNPRLIYAAISGFGQTGPYAERPALDIVAQAMGGVMSITGEEGGTPLRPGVSIGDLSAGLFTAIAILAALHERQRSGKGQMIDSSMLDCIVALEENAFARYFATGEAPRRLGSRHPAFTPFQSFQTKDGYIVVAIAGGINDQWPLFCATIGHLELIDDPRYQDGWMRTQNYYSLEPVLSSALRAKSSAEWLEEFQAVGIACGPVNDIPHVATDPQVLHRRMFVESPLPNGGAMRLVNTPFKFSRSQSGGRGAAPQLGEHTEQVLRSWLGLSAAKVRELKRRGVV